MWLLRPAEVTVEVIETFFNPPHPAVANLTPPSFLPGRRDGKLVTISSFDPPLPYLRTDPQYNQTTHLTVTGTGLDRLPGFLTLGPFVLSTYNLSNTSARLGPLPTQKYTVDDVLRSLPHPLVEKGMDPGLFIRGTRRLLGEVGGLGCAAQSIRTELAKLPGNTTVDITDFLIHPQFGSVTLIPKLLTSIAFPDDLYHPYNPTIRAGGQATEIKSNNIFGDLASRPIADDVPVLLLSLIHISEPTRPY